MENEFYAAQKTKPDIRELTIERGLGYPSDEELLMLILNKGTRECPVEQLAHKAMKVINTSNPEDLVERLTRIDGIGYAKALALAAAVEIGRRRNSYLKSVITSPLDILPYVKHFSLEQREHFVSIALNGSREIIEEHVVSVGTSKRTMVHPREVFNHAVRVNASGIICCHNHPFGKCLPSREDMNVTSRLLLAGEVLGITVLDHIIITQDSYFSFLEHGMLKKSVGQERGALEGVPLDDRLRNDRSWNGTPLDDRPQTDHLQDDRSLRGEPQDGHSLNDNPQDDHPQDAAIFE